MHFNQLNYSLANETTDIELIHLEENTSKILCIAGSGSRFTPLLSKNPESIDVVDSSLQQLYMAELRYQCIKQLSYSEYLKILGYTICESAERLSIFKKIVLKKEIIIYFTDINTSWVQNGFLLIGSWEKKLQILRKIFYCFHFKNLEKIFCDNNKVKFPFLAWNIFCKLFLNEAIIGRLLYSGQSKYNRELPLGQFLNTAFSKQIKLSENLKNEFFMQLVFTGKLQPSAWPIETDETVFKQSKQSKTRVQFLQKNLTELDYGDYNFYSLSDVFSYLPDQLSQKIIDQIASSDRHSKTVLRYFMYEPKLSYSDFNVEIIDSTLDSVPIYKMYLLEKK